MSIERARRGQIQDFVWTRLKFSWMHYAQLVQRAENLSGSQSKTYFSTEHCACRRCFLNQGTKHCTSLVFHHLLWVSAALCKCRASKACVPQVACAACICPALIACIMTSTCTARLEDSIGGICSLRSMPRVAPQDRMHGVAQIVRNSHAATKLE